MATSFKAGGSGYVQTDGIAMTVQDTITARAGGGQGSATQLTGPIVRVTTVASAADSVKLPAPREAGDTIYIRNSGANSMQVFGSGTDTINGVATATGVAQAAGTLAQYIAMTSGTAAAWFRLLSA